MISNGNDFSTEDQKDQHIEWPEDPVSKAKIVRAKTLSMTADVELVSNGFVTGEIYSFSLMYEFSLGIISYLTVLSLCNIVQLLKFLSHELVKLN